MKNGNILRCISRTPLTHELFLLVIEEEDQTEDQFKAVVLFDNCLEYKRGEIHNNWNKGNFEQSCFSLAQEFGDMSGCEEDKHWFKEKEQE